MFRWTAGTKARADLASRQHGYRASGVPSRLLLARRPRPAPAAATATTQPSTSAAVGAAQGHTEAVAAAVVTNACPAASSGTPQSCRAATGLELSGGTAVPLASTTVAPAAPSFATTPEPASKLSKPRTSPEENIATAPFAPQALERPSMPPAPSPPPSPPSPSSSPLPTLPPGAVLGRDDTSATESTATTTTTTTTTSASVLSGQLQRHSGQPRMAWVRDDGCCMRHAAPPAASSQSSSTAQAKRLVEAMEARGAAHQRQVRKHARQHSDTTTRSSRVRGDTGARSSDEGDDGEGEADTYAKIRWRHQQQLLEHRAHTVAQSRRARCASAAAAASSITSAGVFDSQSESTQKARRRRRYSAAGPSVDCVSVQLPLRHAPEQPVDATTTASALPAVSTRPVYGDVSHTSLVAEDACPHLREHQTSAAASPAHFLTAEVPPLLDPVQMAGEVDTQREEAGTHGFELGGVDLQQPIWALPWQCCGDGDGCGDVAMGGAALQGCAPPDPLSSVFEDRPLGCQCWPLDGPPSTSQTHTVATHEPGSHPAYTKPWASSSAAASYQAGMPDCLAPGGTGSLYAAWTPAVPATSNGRDVGGPLWPTDGSVAAADFATASGPPPPPLLFSSPSASWPPPASPYADMSALPNVWRGSEDVPDTSSPPGLVRAVMNHTDDNAGPGWGAWRASASTKAGWQHGASSLPPCGPLSTAAPAPTSSWMLPGIWGRAADEHDGPGYAFATQDVAPPPGVPWMAGGVYPEPPAPTASSLLAVPMPQPLCQLPPPDTRSLQDASRAFPVSAATAPVPNNVWPVSGEGAPRQRPRRGSSGVRAPRPLNGTTERCRRFWERCRYPGGSKP